MAEAVILLATEKLERLLAEKSEFLKDAEEQVRWLINELKTTSSFLERQEKSRVHQYVMPVAEIAYDADVYIDTFVSDVENSTSISHLLENFKEEIESIGSRIKAVRAVGPARVEEESTVGLKGEVELLLKKAISYLTQEFSITYILGTGGIGKTALASLLYNHAKVVDHFKIRAWVHVSYDFSVKKVLIELIQELGTKGEPEYLESLSLGNLRARVFRHLKQKDYFIVLDNVWSDLDLDKVLNAFPRNDLKGRIVITSRSRSIIRTGFITSRSRSISRTGSILGMEFNQYVHEKKFLNASESWDLFLKKVFPRGIRCPKDLEEIGREIVRKCNGLPLALDEAGRKLAKKEQSEKSWREFLESMDLSDTSASLEISFNRLSARLKSCFSRLGFFEEGTTIRVNKLLHICVAGGMLPQPSKEDQTDEEIGRKDLEELIGEYLVQVKDRTRDNQVKNCDINYNLHRLAITKAKQELMFEVMTEGQNHQSSNRTRHRALCCQREMFNYSTNHDKHLVSLFFWGGGRSGASQFNSKSFQMLKVLDFEGFGLENLPEVVGTLITLKYLGLRNNCLEELPCSLDQLKKLEVLDIALNFLVEVPNFIWKMNSLRHLYMSDITFKDPLKIDELHKLQTLTYISVDWMYEVSGLKMLTSLRKLGIEEVNENSNVSELIATLAELEKLEHLILRGFRFESMPELEGLQALRGLKQLKLDGLLTRLPNEFPPNIEYLSLSNSCLHEDPMPILEKLPKLLYLKLKNAFMGKQMVISAHGFRELQILCLEQLWHLRTINVEEDALEWPIQLEIKSCPNLETLPKEIELMKNLKELKVVTTKGIAVTIWNELKMVTTEGNAATIQKSSFIPSLEQVDIQP